MENLPQAELNVGKQNCVVGGGRVWLCTHFLGSKIYALVSRRECRVATSSMTPVIRACPIVAINWLFHYILDEDLS